MKLTQPSVSIGAISVFLVLSAPAYAFNFNPSTDLGSCDTIPLESLGANGVSTSTVSSCTTADGITLTAGPNDAVLTLKEVNGVKGVGVFHDVHPEGSIQEIDYDESLMLSFSESIVKSLDLSFLYKAKTPGEFVFGDVVNEVAKITASGVSGNLTGYLTVQGDTSATWSLGGNVINLSPSNGDGGGWYSIANPFGDLAVTSVKFTSPLEAGQNYTYSDFAVSGSTIAPVPEPSLLIGLSTLGVVMTVLTAKTKE